MNPVYFVEANACFILIGDIYAAQREVGRWTKQVRRGAHFSGFRSNQFNAVLAVLAERIEALRERSALLGRPEDVLDELAPVRQAKDGSFELDTERAREAIREEQRILRDIFEIIETIRQGAYHELEAMGIISEMGQQALNAFEGESGLSLETQERLRYAMRYARTAAANFRASGTGNGGAEGGSRGAGFGGNRRAGRGGRSYGGGEPRQSFNNGGYAGGFFGGGRGRERSFDRGFERPPNGGPANGGARGGSANVCYFCGEAGHFRNRCPKRERDQK